MNIVFRISTRIRSCAPIPRGFGVIKGLEHLGLVLRQSVFSTPEEFNATLAEISDSRFPNRGCQFFPYALTAEDEAKLNDTSATETPVAPEEAEWTPPSPDTEYVVAVDPGPTEAPTEEESVTTPEAPPKFTLVENDIFMQGERVGGIYENGLRCSKGYAELRDEIEAWLNTQPE